MLPAVGRSDWTRARVEAGRRPGDQHKVVGGAQGGDPKGMYPSSVLKVELTGSAQG